MSVCAMSQGVGGGFTAPPASASTRVLDVAVDSAVVRRWFEATLRTQPGLGGATTLVCAGAGRPTMRVGASVRDRVGLRRRRRGTGVAALPRTRARRRVLLRATHTQHLRGGAQRHFACGGSVVRASSAMPCGLTSRRAAIIHSRRAPPIYWSLYHRSLFKSAFDSILLTMALV